MRSSMTKKVSSKVFCPASGTWTVNYTDGTVSAIAGDIFSEFEVDLPAGINVLTEELGYAEEELQAKRKSEGRCLSCGAVREMTAWGLKDCEICLT